MDGSLCNVPEPSFGEMVHAMQNEGLQAWDEVVQDVSEGGELGALARDGVGVLLQAFTTLPIIKAKFYKSFYKKNPS